VSVLDIYKKNEVTLIELRYNNIVFGELPSSALEFCWLRRGEFKTNTCHRQMPSSRRQLDKYNTIILIIMHYKGQFDYEWWKLFQKPVVCTKFDIYVFIPFELWKGFKNNIKSNTGKYWQLIWHNNVIDTNTFRPWWVFLLLKF